MPLPARASPCAAEPNTLRNGEQERRVPHGPAYALLVAIDRDPKTMMRLLKEA